MFLTLDKCKKNFQFKTVCNGNTAYITQQKQKKNKKGAIILVAHRHNINVLLSNSTFLIFAVTSCFKLELFLQLYLLFYYIY